MTILKFFKTNGKFVKLECSGHTGYDEFGKDVLCATIYAKLERQLDDGNIKFELPKNIDDNKLNQSQILFETVFVSIEDLQKGYSKYISMEVIE